MPPFINKIFYHNKKVLESFSSVESNYPTPTPQKILRHFLPSVVSLFCGCQPNIYNIIVTRVTIKKLVELSTDKLRPRLIFSNKSSELMTAVDVNRDKSVTSQSSIILAQTILPLSLIYDVLRKNINYDLK